MTARGEEIAAEPQVFALVQFLIENRDRVVSKDEIFEHVWDGRIVSDGTLNSRINSARRALGDDGKAQAVIKTFPRRGFRFVAQVDDDNVTETMQTAPLISLVTDKPSIAVLPFDNISNDPEQEYFSDGITEDIITELSKISGLFVIARHSAFTYKGKSVTLMQVGRELGVRYVLEGSVRKAQNRLRITAQLIDATSGHHMWAERYDRDLEDIFAVQDEVARQVAGALAVALKPGEAERLAHAPTDNLEAYDVYLRARMTFYPPTRANILTARGAYGHVIDTDPSFAGGHAGKSITHSMAVMFGHSENPDEDARIALEFAERAVTIDEQFALSHSALGFAYSAARRHDEAIAAARRAVALQPGDADSHFFLAYCQLRAGHGEEARDSILTALRLDPQYVAGPYLNALGRACFVAGRYQEARDTFERNVAHGGPLGVPMLATWLASLVELGRLDDAREIAQRLIEFDPGFSLTRAGNDAFGLASETSRERIVEALRKVGLPE